MSARGVFITVEGGEGSGKSTQLRILSRRLAGLGLKVRELREPGGTRTGEAVRSILLGHEHAGLDPRAELLLYEAARAQLVAEVIAPGLESGEVILCDRFYDSSTAYQGYGRGLPLDEVRALNRAATGGLEPDVTLLFDVDPMIGLERATREGADRLESEDVSFHERVRSGFLELARQESGRMRVVDASQSIEAISEAAFQALASHPALAGLIEGAR